MPSIQELSRSENSPPPSAQATAQSQAFPAHALPKGVVLDKDGKPCRTCTSSAAWLAMMKSGAGGKPNSNSNSKTNTAAAAVQPAPQESSVTEMPSDCPADTETLGRHTWTFLHTLTATYPPTATPTHQSRTTTFLRLFAQLYPCWTCAEDFQTWIDMDENRPEKFVRTREEFGRWMCRAHNEVNRKLGKKEFDCDFWGERWRDGWKDGRCG